MYRWTDTLVEISSPEEGCKECADLKQQEELQGLLKERIEAKKNKGVSELFTSPDLIRSRSKNQGGTAFNTELSLSAQGGGAFHM